MKAKALARSYFDHLIRRGKSTPVPDKGFAVIFGTDEYKVNLRRRMVRFPDSDWIECPGISAEVIRNADWMAMVYSDDMTKWTIYAGIDDPFVEPYPEQLPMQDGELLAMPFAVVDAATEAAGG